MGLKRVRRQIVILTVSSVLLCQLSIPAMAETKEEVTDDRTSETIGQTEVESVANVSVKNPDKEEENFTSLAEALQHIEDNSVVTINQDVVLTEPIVISQKNVTIKASTKVTVTKAIPEMNMIQVIDGGSLTLAGDLVFDGQKAECRKALVEVAKDSSLTMKDNVTLTNARCGWKNFASVKTAGTFNMEGGEISNAMAAYNAGVFVQTGGVFKMTAGKITGNRSSWTEGGVLVSKGGKMDFEAGQISQNESTNESGITVDEGGSLTLGTQAKMSDNQIVLAGDTTKIDINHEGEYSNDQPLDVIVEKPSENRVIFDFNNDEDAVKARQYIRVQSPDKQIFPLVVASADQKQLVIAPQEQLDKLAVLQNPYKDHLCLEFKDDLTTEEGRKQIQETIDTLYSGLELDDKRHYQERLDYLTQQYEYLQANKDKIHQSVEQLSQLGDASEEAKRTQQSLPFDNLDITGYYVKPGQVNDLNVYVDASDPQKVLLISREVGATDTDRYQSLNVRRYELHNGCNHIQIDLTQNKHGEMLCFRNNASDNKASVRIEAADANQTQTIEGHSLGRHPYFIYQDNADQFYHYLQDVSKLADEVEKTKEQPLNEQVQDMTMIQVGTTQLAMRATLLKKIIEEEKIDTPEAATEYIKHLNESMNERLAYFWKYAGFADEDEGVNHISPQRLCIIFTPDIRYPSNMYAINNYYHMPEEAAKDFMSGKDLYSWAMSHEYGHMLDNRSFVVPEETNNMYSLWGSRHQAIKNFKADGSDTFDPTQKNTVYHPKMKWVEQKRDAYLVNRLKNPYIRGGFNAEDGFYKVLMWFLGTHYFDNWDYQNYDYDHSPYTKELAEEVKKFGVYGTSLRLMRSEEGRKIDAATANHYQRMVIAFTIASGYNFAEYMETVGEINLPQKIKDFCAQYPSMPRKVQYYSLEADGKEAMGFKAYEGNVEPTITVTDEGGTYHIKTTLPEEQQKATIAYELYQDDKLIDLSRDGVFEVAKTTAEKPHFTVKTYDFRLNESHPSTETKQEDSPKDEQEQQSIF